MGLNVIVVGGSGYLGQFVICSLRGKHNVVYTYHSKPLPVEIFPEMGFKLDLASGAGLDELVGAVNPIHVVVNCAAISQPALCENDYELACAINVPSKLVAALEKQWQASQPEALLIHISTDQVYDGSRPWWREDSLTEPVNAYGRSKLAAEQHVKQHWPNSVVLRSSLIYGPAPAVPVGRPLFIQFVDGQLKQAKPISFFSDEFRCPIYVEDICKIVGALVGCYPSSPSQPMYNMGGPQRLSRVDMARAVADHMGYSHDCIQEASSSSVDRGYASPLDISMDMALLKKDMPAIKLTSLSDALPAVLKKLGPP